MSRMNHSNDVPMAAYFSIPYVSFPALFMSEYREIGLLDNEMMLILHIFTFQQLEQTMFPTISDLSNRMSLTADEIFALLQKLVKRGYIRIVPITYEGQVSEQIDLSPVIGMLTRRLHPEPELEPEHHAHLTTIGKNLFGVFESEFGRPLTAIEYEQIIQWLDKDGYEERIILEALRESVLSGKYNFKYIDRILFEWSKQNIKTVQQLNTHREEYKQKKSETKKTTKSAPERPTGTKSKATNNKYDVFYQLYQQGASQ
jgi:DNA replication protein